MASDEWFGLDELEIGLEKTGAVAALEVEFCEGTTDSYEMVVNENGSTHRQSSFL